MFGNPTYLFALAGLAIPVVIHFLSRKEGKVIKLGSVRHVVETSTQQFKGIKLNEIILLMLRCAMIIVFSFLLSGLRCSTLGQEKWAIVEKGFDGLPNLNSVLDSLKNDGYSLHLLTNGFPELKDSGENSVEINYWQLMEELKIKNLSEAIVFSKNNINHFKGMRFALPTNVRWISQPFRPLDFTVSAIRFNNDSVSLRKGHSASDKTYFTTEKISVKESQMAITPQDIIKILLVSDAQFSYDHKIIKTAIQTIEKFFIIKIILTESDPSKISSSSADWCIWLSAQKMDKMKAKKIIRFNDQSSSELIVQEGSNQWALTKRLNQEVALQNNLATQLATLLLPEKKLLEMITDNDLRMVSDSLAWGRRDDVKEIQASIYGVPADQYLIILLLALLIVERMIAYKRNQ